MITMKRPEVNPAGRYSISETSRLLGIGRGTLLSWTKQGYIKCQYHRIGYRKFYTGTEIVRCWNMIA